MARKATVLTMLAAAGLAAFGLAADASAQFYKGKTITILVGYSAGSGVTHSARSFAPYFAKHIPGNPEIIVKNMPGGGGVRAQNFTYEKMRPDGLSLYFGPIGIVGRIIGAPGNRVKYENLTFIGAAGRSIVQYARKAALPGFKEPADITKVKKPLNMACTRPTSNFCILNRMAFEFLNVPYSVVAGFRGANKVAASLLQGEIDTHLTPAYSYRLAVEPNLVKRGEAVPLWYFELEDSNGKLRPNPRLSDLASFSDVYRKTHNGKDPAGPMWDAMQWITTFLGRLILGVYGPPGIPEEQTATLRKAFNEVLADKEYEADYLKQYRVKYNVTPTADALKFFSRLRKIDPETVALMKKFGARMESKKKKK